MSDPDNWLFAPADSDPHADHRPESPTCGPQHIRTEDGELEVFTDFCDYLDVHQTTLAPAYAGETIEVRWAHDFLDAESPTQGHISLHLEGEILFEAFPAIPQDAGEYVERFELRRDLQEGVELRFHLHNHGVNSWRLTSVWALPPGREAPAEAADPGLN